MTIIRDTINLVAEALMWGGFGGLVFCLIMTAITGDTSWLTAR